MTKVEKLRERFKNHIATLTQHGDLQVLTWRKKGTSIYSIRFVFDGSCMYISGDMGDAVFSWQSVTELHSFKKMDLGYFAEKISTMSMGKYIFDEKVAMEKFENWLEYNLAPDDIDEAQEQSLQEFKNEIESIYSLEEWRMYVHDASELFEEFMCDWSEHKYTLYDFGKELHPNIQAYLVGLQMAAEQLSEKEVHNGR